MGAITHYITRQSMLYKTGVEYGDYTMNHVLGCAHGCRYPCYAYLMKRRFGQVYDEFDWCCPRLVGNTLGLLDKEIPRLKNRIQCVQLCFSTDPFMYGYEAVEAMSLAALQKLTAAGLQCSVLTKGVLPLELAAFKGKVDCGISLVSLDERFRRQWEPGAAPVAERLGALKALYEAGCTTWVSIEPYPSPLVFRQALLPLLEEVGFVTKLVFGRLNYNKMVGAAKVVKPFYNACADEVLRFCAARGIECHIKSGTKTN